MASPAPDRPPTAVPLQARREAVQPSLWDRLIDDLPALSAEIARRKAALTARHGAAGLRALLAGQGREGLDPEQARDLAALAQLQARHAALQERGIRVTPDVLREAVRRDIEDLFGIERLEVRYLLTPAERRAAPPGIAGGAEDPAEMLADFPHVRASVLNYGVPAFAGRRAGDFDHEALARELREVLAVFEPRLRRDTIRVRVEPGTRIGLRVRIEGLLLMAPAPERLRLLTTIDLDTGIAATVLEEG
ncbi:type VI secretion system baseplate subunit TssE [Paracoccus sp. P2]|uniref:GPW/gp25 family protein n=1 Tax=Paracoccus pantotrophus TaxID=82367 RepID=A0A7H9BWG0_PARPN|nr:GPW/gp25 family protein [Paracoccus pantotrophus]MDF3854708.1 GPW/gp25 family protein [Paracoccus pantotrophus]QLH15754.1 GPW/gp25 family protein [Paracoccus pantotrophus]RNI19772.1 type VI secretion system baseplate subunit TssE [Paracoccus pantotrophus]WGR63955.1 type VI secretion system baseplate subunit TssE [Paracoccus pantotrophus]SFO48774.1 type VI secretion system protein ImpF [Paracoccus pantotrophus]